MIQPHLILDKSVLQMLNRRELFELSIFFEVIGTPVLTNEILADLEKPASKHRLPLDVVKALAAKRWASPMEPMHFRKAAFTNLLYQDVPMKGATFIDIDAPHVSTGVGVSINLSPVQQVWARWAAGDFSPLDKRIARTIRAAMEDYDPAVIRRVPQPLFLVAPAREWVPRPFADFAKGGNHERRRSRLRILKGPMELCCRCSRAVR